MYNTYHIVGTSHAEPMSLLNRFTCSLARFPTGLLCYGACPVVAMFGLSGQCSCDNSSTLLFLHTSSLSRQLAGQQLTPSATHVCLSVLSHTSITCSMMTCMHTHVHACTCMVHVCTCVWTQCILTSWKPTIVCIWTYSCTCAYKNMCTSVPRHMCMFMYIALVHTLITRVTSF